MSKTLKTVVIVVLAIAFFVFVLLRFVLLLLPRGAFSRIPQTPIDREYADVVWVCEKPYMWFATYRDELGTCGKGELETEDGEKLAVRFIMERNEFYAFLEGSYLEIGEDGEPHPAFTEEACIMSGVYRMNRKGTEVKLSPSTGEDEIYHDKYGSFTFYRQDPAGTEESAAQP